MRKLLPATLLLLALGYGVWHVATTVTDHPAVGDGRLHEVAPGVFVHRAFASNAGVIIANESVLLVDAHASAAGARSLASGIERLTPYPVTHVFLVGERAMHAGGAGAFEAAELVATAKSLSSGSTLASTLALLGLPVRAETPASEPTRVVASGAVLQIDKLTVEVRDVGTTFAPGAAFVWLPELKVLFTGDALTTHGLPWTGELFADTAIDAQGSWKQALDVIRALRPRVLVPAHGPVLEGEIEIAARVDVVTRVLDAASTAATSAGDGPVDEALVTVVAALDPVLEPLGLDETFVSRRQLALAVLASTRAAGWRSLEPRGLPRAERGDALQVLDGTDASQALERARELVDGGRLPLAVSVIEEQLARTPTASHFNGLLADVLLTSAAATDVVADRAVVAARALDVARRELALTPREPLASLALGCLATWGAAVTGESMAASIVDLETALASEALDRAQRRRAKWCLARAHAIEGHEGKGDAWLRAWLPAPMRFAFPLFAPRLRALP